MDEKYSKKVNEERGSEILFILEAEKKLSSIIQILWLQKKNMID